MVLIDRMVELSLMAPRYGALIVVSLALAVTSCTAEPSGIGTSGLSGNLELPAGASAFQHEVVERYERGEKVTFEDYSQAVRDTKACLSALGFEITNEQNVTEAGLPIMTYEAKVPKALAEAKGSDFFDAAYQECWQNNSAVVESLYADTGISVEQLESNLAAVKAQYGPLIEKCLHDLGVERPAGAPDDWWGEAVIEANQSLPGNPDCMASTGYTDATNALPGSDG